MSHRSASNGGSRRIVTLLTLTLVFAVVGTPALATQGGYYKGSGWVGSRAYLIGTANIDSHAGVIAALRVQSAVSGTGLYQTGKIKQGSNFTTDCGTGGNGSFAERQSTSSATYLCNMYHSGTFNNGDEYAVRFISGSGWVASRNTNNFDGPYSLGFSSGYPFAVSEKFNTVTSYSFTYGPSGQRPWQVQNSIGSWNTVSTATMFNEDGGWTITALPSPFSISR